ncbi:hypothetical protein FS320_12740 [Microvirga tunisiensis]|uniref:Anticodon-binding domain-containing protein n=1 Tax=Microvirga tunisiensis TaxID=2108360 RepID=A0A5N7MG91_9HYPH|nr:hypothetical protein [Microvirga tunisiensis]MPR26071.1 hypothetical protein [Microvirga tunisiensis]
MFDVLSEAGLRSILDDAAAPCRAGSSTREMAIPVLAVIGCRDAAANAVSLKFRDCDLGMVPLAEAAAAIRSAALDGRGGV